MTHVTKGISPKAAAAVITAVATYLVTQQALALPAWAVVLCQLVLVAAAAYAAPVGHVEPAEPASSPSAAVADDLSTVPEFAAERRAAVSKPVPVRKPRPSRAKAKKPS